MIVFLFLLAVCIAASWARLVRPGSNAVIGPEILVATLPLLARVRMHAMPTALTLALTLAVGLTGDLPGWFAVLPLASVAAMILIPVRYTLTPVGIRLGWTSFRRWTEFSGVRRAPGGARLIGIQRLKGMTIWLSGSRGDDEFLHFLRQMIKNAYKGHASAVASPGDWRSSEIDGTSASRHVAAFTSENS